MKTAFVAAEYNPFHNGHKYLIDKIKESGYDAIIAVMSGDFVQRGDIAICEKHIRARAALSGGADLILELPVRYALSNAHYFAEGFIKTVKASGVKGDFVFGATASKDKLVKISEIIYSSDVQNICKEKSRNEGISYPAALSAYLSSITGKYESELCREPNNILALEYIRAIKDLCPDFGILSIERYGPEHDSDITDGKFASAGYIREQIYRQYNSSCSLYNMYNLMKYIPENIFEILNTSFLDGRLPADKNKFQTAVLSRLFQMSSSDFLEINNVTEGLENRISEALNSSFDLDTLYSKIKSKRYTHSRIRQIITDSVLDIKRQDLERDISYIRVLGSNSTGRTLLREIKNSASVPVYSNLSEADLDNGNIKRDIELDCNASKLFNLCLNKPMQGNPSYDIPPVMI